MRKRTTVASLPEPEFGPHSVGEFLRRYGLPAIPASDLTPGVCAAFASLARQWKANHDELERAQKRLEGLARQLQRADTQLMETEATLVAAEQRETLLKEMSHTDVLTGLNNRRALLEELSSIIERRKPEEGQPFTRRNQKEVFPTVTIAMFDLNDFKAVNSRYQHAGGDAVLQHAAQVLKDNLRKSDRIYRYGGEEFMVIMYKTSRKAAEKVAEQIMDAMARTPCRYTEPRSQQEFIIPVSVAYGVHELTSNDTPESVMAATSEAMLNHKDRSKQYARTFQEKMQALKRHGRC